MLILFISLIATLILASVESRILLGIYRTQASEDIVLTEFIAESYTNDLLWKILGNYPVPAMIPEFTMPDGITMLSMESTSVGDETIYNIIAKRPYSVRKFRAIYNTTSTDLIDKIQIAIGLDCTGSMNTKDDGIKTRFEYQEQAVINFIDTIAYDPTYAEIKDRMYLGISVFNLTNRWIEIGGGVTADPSLKFADYYLNLKSTITSGFGNIYANSPLCWNLAASTSVGTPYSDAHKFFRDNPEGSTTKRFEIVITDGETNSRPPDPGCPPSPYNTTNTFCPYFEGYTLANSGGIVYGNSCTANPQGWTNPDGWMCGCASKVDCESKCTALGKDYLRCVLSPNDGSNNWQSEIDTNAYPGIRDPDVDAYGVTVLPAPPADIVIIYEKYIGNDHYYNATQATQLPTILSDILNKIHTNTVTIIMQPAI